MSVPGLAEIELPGLLGAYDVVGVTYRGATTAYADGTLGPYPADAPVAPDGRAPWTEGLGVVLRRLADELPGRSFALLGTGLTAHEDDWRTEVLQGSARQLEQAVADGLPVTDAFWETVVDGWTPECGLAVPDGVVDTRPGATAERRRPAGRRGAPCEAGWVSDDDARVRAKEDAGRHAAGYVTDGMKVGLGTGSTVHFTILELGERRPDIVCTATSRATDELATSLGLRVISPDEIGTLDIAIDGADEVDPAFNLTKGGGGAHTREKIVESMTSRLIVVVDETKLVPALGPFGIPLEVLDFAPATVIAAVEALGAAGVSTRDHRSDNGNLLMDADFGSVADPVALAARLAAVPGIVEHGIFPGAMVERVVVAGAAGVHELVNPR